MSSTLLMTEREQRVHPMISLFDSITDQRLEALDVYLKANMERIKSTLITHGRFYAPLCDIPGFHYATEMVAPSKQKTDAHLREKWGLQIIAIDRLKTHSDITVLVFNVAM